MTSPSVEVFVRARADVGEGPVVRPGSTSLNWIDLSAGVIYESCAAEPLRTIAELPTSIGAAVPRSARDGFAVAVGDGFGFVENGQLEVTDPVLADSPTRMNDGKVDSRGRLWAGSLRADLQPGSGSLHRWDGIAPSVVVRGGLTLPNGIGWSPADDQMYLVDSFAGVVLHASFDPDAGTIGVFTVLVDLAGELPDGIAVDAEGSIWVAVWGSGEVRRYSSEGHLLQTIRMPVTQPSSCAFGPDGTLYITSARAGLIGAALAREPLAGSVFAVATDTVGVPVAAFGA